MTSHTGKRARVEAIVSELNDDLSSNTLSNAQRRGSLEQLKVWGRDPTGAEAIYCESGITTLTTFALGNYPPDVAQEALRTLANALLLRPTLSTVLISLNGLVSVAKLYQNQDDDFEFLGARLLFLCTYTTADFQDTFAAANLIESIEQHLARHAAQLDVKDSAISPMESMAFTETAKLIFNLNDKYPEKTTPLNSAVTDICKILLNCPTPNIALDYPIGPILNALACLDLGAVPAQSTKEPATNDLPQLSDRLIKILDGAIQQYKPLQLDSLAISLITVLRMLYETSSADIQASMRNKILPADSERDLPLGKSSSLASRLLRLTNAPGLTNFPEALASLMFEMSDKDAAKFVKNVGYGYASGYLVSHKIPIPSTIKDPATIGETSDKVPINPVTGQRLDKEAVPDMPEMTQEEKEKEAERLFVLFERLKATGVVDVENPVRQAMEQGRLEEVSDSD